ncbi:hypothetical protein N7522_010467 [Penicillium canescens]|uniref:Uncharacterized protein n=1 Tax=Penicillium canescens TaxID=5083 RepID=A0AAD6IIZ2_PENCN|nr:uncharacterized protein N7446_006055 [Penicillium canescens]KAJ5990260.1 hypothetical protein N7522_010467 [Penicillium canescens]KAJ6051423.1 hypothetical protein N7460_001957 [Penicillium canescens]KAJ6061935.1 hypothetical protein N7446_006055 [Penicillium canescens]KAJ6065186.1 hypothetical protein N7444_000839 [Penicillium canescens]KAJ6183043.1 hypothetical protein N7485_001685 [Penicillium canescens]
MGSCGGLPPIPSSQVGVPVRDILRFLSAGHVSSRVASQQVEIGTFLFLFAPDFRVDNPGIWHIFLECHFRSTTHVAPRRFEFGYTPAIGLPADHRRIWGYHDDPCLTMRINLAETPWAHGNGNGTNVSSSGLSECAPGCPEWSQFYFPWGCFSSEAIVRFSRTDISFAEFPQTRQRR